VFVVGRFPISLLPLVRCTKDAGVLSVPGQEAEALLVEGRARCATCGAEFTIRAGILDMLGEGKVADAESAHEHDMRDIEAPTSRGAPGVPSSVVDELEIASTMRHLGEVTGRTVLELGCGAGVYTRLLALSHARVLAVDFSWAHLQLSAQQAIYPQRVGLVRADVATLKLAPEAFDVALTTLYSNLPSRDLRLALNRLVHSALRPGGKYLVSAHHQDLRRRLRGAPARGHYSGSGIFFESLTADDLARELSDDFPTVHTVPAAICLPLVTRFLRDPIQRWAERLPGFNQLGAILLADARKG
jgi:SAM-dependent methyltransferase